MIRLPIFLVLLGAQAPQPAVLEFPEPGLDDPASYEGYATRFFRDSEGNAFQIYLDSRSGRVVHLWANAANESAGFTVRDSDRRPAPVRWAEPTALARSRGASRSVRHRLAIDAGDVELGGFLLGSMRKERDFQYSEAHLRPFDAPPFLLTELVGLIESLEHLPGPERERHLALLGARSVADVRARLEPRVTLQSERDVWVARIEHVTLDGRNRLSLELRGDRRNSIPRLEGRTLSIRAARDAGLALDITVTTDAGALHPLTRREIFNTAFERFYDRERAAYERLRDELPPDARDPQLLAFRRLEREVRALELLSYEEKLMAGLPNFATYFGRDMMMATLMMEPIWSVAMQEHVITSVLRKLSPSGEVSHEEALGGQAIRENAAEYSALVRRWAAAAARADATAAARALARARALLENLQAVRENYRMIDDDFQLPVLVARYLSRDDVPADRKRRFLLESGPRGVPRVRLLLKNLELVAALARPYAQDPVATNLVSFLHRDEEGWIPGSWRDSRAGYANGRYAMDVNVVWVPKALEALSQILRVGAELELGAGGLAAHLDSDTTTFTRHLRDPSGLSAAAEAWDGARRHFEVAFTPDELRRRVRAMLDWMPEPESAYWRGVLERTDADARPLRFLALALDAEGRPIPVAHTDLATDLFVETYTEAWLRGAVDAGAVSEMLDVFLRPYPLGLFVSGLGPLAANDAYAGPGVWERFWSDAYHSPRVVWGREVNLLFLGLAHRVETAYDSAGRLRSDRPEFRAYVAELRRALETTRRAVEASGLRHNELWSYRIEEGELRPVRYGTSSDIQLWNVTDLAVRFLLDRLPPP